MEELSQYGLFWRTDAALLYRAVSPSPVAIHTTTITALSPCRSSPLACPCRRLYSSRPALRARLGPCAAIVLSPVGVFGRVEEIRSGNL
jgi:hypothetical protein